LALSKGRAKFQETIPITRKNQIIREIKESIKSAIQTKGKVSHQLI
jgi:hypothetical protein